MRKTRYIILAVMTAITAGSLLLFPKININEDMTRYLPDDSGMKRGVDRMKEQFPEIDLNAYWIKAMFSGVDDRDSLARELGAIPGIAGISSVEEKDSLIMFQLAVDQGADTRAVASHISATCGNKVVVEHNANSIMPENMGLILTIGAAIVFGILFLMCSSIVEALLFILTIGMAVIINMGTNALLPSVSMMTNTIVAVLQLVLSMDYSIILMNRFRQVLDVESDIDKAMGLALKSASPSILSSSLTTIVGLLALMFMKFRIGMDLGIVLAKGVFLSLLSIYTILPALVLIFYKGIRKTSKKVFLIPTGRLAEFELRFRIPITVLFILIFAASCYLSGKTELSYASIWESEINEAFPPKNAFSILYKTSSEDNLIALADSLDAKDGVVMTFSYPSMFKKQLTFKSVLIPTILVMTVLTGVNINVIFNGLGGHTMLYLAYLIVQSILIGSTIDYGILFTNYYLDLRRTGQSISDSLKSAYRGSIHTIMTSGLIIILAPFIMSELLTDPTICSILSSLTFGALAVILLIVLALPALLATVDKAIIRRSGQTRKQKSQLIE